MSDTVNSISREDRSALKDLCTISDAAGLKRLAGHSTLIAGASAAVWFSGEVTVTLGDAWSGWLVQLPSQLVLGIFLVFLFTPLHETVHRTAFKTRWLNDAVSHVAGFILILPPRYFRAFHLDHHRFTQIPGKDPELPSKEIKNRRQFLLTLTGLRYWFWVTKALFQRAIFGSDEPFLSGRNKTKVRQEAIGYVLFYALIIGLSIGFANTWILQYWVIPVLLGQPFLRAYLMAEHGGCPLVPDMFANTRTTVTNGFLRYIAWNMPYHVEHHAFMAIPFHRLPEAHTFLKNDIQVLSPGYIAFHREIWKSLPV